MTVPGAAPVRPLVPLVPTQPTAPDRSGFVPAVGSPDRSAPTPRTVPADRSADRSATSRADRSGSAARNGSGGKPTGRARTDAELFEQIRLLAAEQDGRPPSIYQLKQRFGIGSDRAGRLLGELDTTTNDTTPTREGSAP